MCGLSGMVRLRGDMFPVSADLNTFQNLFITSQLRGVHSSGVTGLWRQRPKGMSIKNTRKILQGLCTYKDTVDPHSAFSELNRIVNRRSFKREKTHERAYYQLLMGHARHATVGKVGADNAHPFCFHNNRFIGTHNGTIYNAEFVFNTLTDTEEPLASTLDTDKDYGNYQSEYTDSERVLYCIYRWGIEKVYPLINGAWAFVWYNQNTGSVYFIRNIQRPLSYSYSSVRDSLHYSSERGMLRFAVERESNDKVNNYRHFEVDTLYGVNLAAKKYITISDKDFPWCVVEKISRDIPFMQRVGITAPAKKITPPVSTGGSDGLDGATTRPPFVNVPIDRRSVHFTLDHNKKKPLDNEDEKTYCLWCIDELEKGKETLEVPMAGAICHVCYNDLVQVEQIIDMYHQCSDNPNWMRQWIELSEAQDNKGELRVKN